MARSRKNRGQNHPTRATPPPQNKYPERDEPVYSADAVNSLTRAAVERGNYRRQPATDPRKNAFGSPTPMTMPGAPGGGPGRPKNNAESRDTLPVAENQMGRTRTQGGWSGLPAEVKRESHAVLSFDNLQYSAKDAPLALRNLSKLSADIATIRRSIRDLVIRPLTVSVKEFTDGTGTADDKPGADKRGGAGTDTGKTGDSVSAEATREDPVATRIARGWLKRAGQLVVADHEGAMGGLNDMLAQWVDNFTVDGAFAGELVPNAARDNVRNIVAFDPQTVELRRDTEHPGYYHIGQRNWDAPGGWRWLNPNLACYRRNGTRSLYGEGDQDTALHFVPLALGFFGKLQIFLHRAAFGFLDATTKIEILQEMWKQVEQSIRDSFGGDFMAWAQEINDFLAESWQNSSEAMPGDIQAHLDLMELKAGGAGGVQFPIPEVMNLMKDVVANATHTPVELIGGKSDIPDKFVALKIETWHAYLVAIQTEIEDALNRFIEVGFGMMGYPKKVQADCKFGEIPIEEKLVKWQAEQLRQLCAKFLRDDNFISQNETARMLIGKPAIGPAPLSMGADPDGPSAPDFETMAAREAAKTDNGSASGPSFGGKKQVKDNKGNGNVGKDKKAEFQELWRGLDENDQKAALYGILSDFYAAKGLIGAGGV